MLFQKIFRKLLPALCFVVTCMTAYAQLYPVQVTPQIVPPYSVYLSDYATPGNEKLRVILLHRDISQPAYQLRLVMNVEWNGKVIMRTSRAFNPTPLNITPGIPTIISGAELSPYLDSRNIEFLGYSREQYERTRALPEGSYRISFIVYDYRRQDVQLSAEGNSFYYLAKNEPPLINYPSCGTKIQMRTPQQIVFSWLPRNTASPNSALDTEYEFSLYETRPAGRNPNDVVQATQPVFRVRTDLRQLVYGPAEPLLLQDMNYVWRVQAIDKNGRDAFRNNGYSEVCTFSYSASDNAFDIGVVKDLKAIGETETRGKVSWTTGMYDTYRIEYKKTGQGYEWFRSNTQKGELKIFDLEPDTEYETRVQAGKTGYFGQYTEIIKFRTLPKRVAHCGETPGLPDINNPGQPLTTATLGMTVNARGQEMVLTQVSQAGGDGWYKGYGKVTLPYLGASYHVKFDKIFINENRDVVFGRIDVLSNGVTGLVEVQVATAKAEQQKRNKEEWADTDFNETVFQYDDIVIANVTVDDNTGLVTITDSTGHTTTNDKISPLLVDATGKAVILEDKNGDQWVVQKDQTSGQTKVTRVEGGGLSSGSATSYDVAALNIQKENILMIILSNFKEEITAWLRINGKGGEEDEDVLLALALPECFPQDVDKLKYINESTIPYFENHKSELQQKIETDQDNKQLFDRVGKSFLGKEVIWSEVSEEDQTATQNAVCKALIDIPSIGIEDKFVININGTEYTLLTMKNLAQMVKDESILIEEKFVHYGYSQETPLKLNLNAAIHKKNDKLQNQNVDWIKIQDNGQEQSLASKKQSDISLTVSDVEQSIKVVFEYEYPVGTVITLPFKVTFIGATPDIYFNGAADNEEAEMIKGIDRTVSVYGANNIDLIPAYKEYKNFILKKETNERAESSYNIEFVPEDKMIKEIKWNGTVISGGDLMGWTNYKLVDVTKVNTLELIPYLGVPTVCKVIPKPAPPVVIERGRGLNEANYGLDDYESYRLLDKKNVSASYQDVKTTINGKDYYGPILKFNAASKDLDLALVPFDMKTLDGPLKYILTLPKGESKVINIKEGIGVLTGSWKLNPPEQEGYVLISDVSGNISRKIKLEKTMDGEFTEFTLQLVRIKYKGKISNNVDAQRISQELAQAYNQIDIAWTVDDKVKDFEITDNDIPADGFSGTGITKVMALKLLGAETLNTTDERDNYQKLLGKIYEKIISKHLDMDKQRYYMFAMHNDFSKVLYGFALVGTNVFYISNSIPARTVAHEVGHNLGLGEVCVDLGRCTSQDKACINTDQLQRGSSNIMGYNDGYEFWRWQYDIIKAKK